MHPVLLNAKVEACNKCNISPNRGFGWGNIQSKIMFIAQNPGWQPDSRSSDIVPFGLDEGGENSGKWLMKLLEEAKLKKEDYYITNVVKCPTPNNRPPKEHEIFHCLEFLRMELETQKPTLIFLMGKVSQDNFFSYMKRLLRNMKDHTYFLHRMWHPGLILRFPKNFDEWRKEFMEFWSQHKHIVRPMKISHQEVRRAKGYVVGDGSWSGAWYSDIYDAEKFQKFLMERM